MPTAEGSIEVQEPRDIPPLPEDWIPDAAVIFAFAELEDEGRWSVVIPGYAVVGVGATLSEAGHEAVELLYDYFRMCAAEGRTFEQSKRTIGLRWLARLLAGQAAESVRHRVRHNSIRGRVLRVPARGALTF